MFKIYVLAYLYSDDNILLLRRKNVTFGSGLYGLAGGQMEQGETARQAIAREVQEELALSIDPSEFELVHTLHRKGTETEFISLCFQADIAGMKPKNNEPDKHDDMRLFKLYDLPTNIIPAHQRIIESVESEDIYSEHGW